MGMESFIKAAGAARTDKWEERFTVETVQSDGAMAVAWVPYSFYLNDEFLHCGVNSFTLLKRKEGWHILAIIDTRREECKDQK